MGESYMSDKLIFTKLQKEDIFCDDFNDFKVNNEIEFSAKGIAVLYAPNGTGKTSLVRVLANSDKCSFNVDYNGKVYDTTNNNLFHIINDQNSRNIIAGSTQDFLLGG
jgi:ABC-type molybdate transport system ATPase subunit